MFKESSILLPVKLQMAYTIDKRTGGDGSRHFFADGPIVDPSELMTHINAQKVCVVSEFPDDATFMQFLTSIQRYGQIRGTDHSRPWASFSCEGGNMEFTVHAYADGCNSSAELSYKTYDMITVAKMIRLFFTDQRVEYGQMAKDLVRDKRLTSRPSNLYYRTTHDESVDSKVKNWDNYFRWCRPEARISSKFFFFRDLKD